MGTVLLSPVSYPVNDPATDLTVTRTRAGVTTELTAGVDWSWTPATPPTVGGSITLTVAAEAGDRFVVDGDYELERAGVLTPANGNSTKSLNAEFDRLWMSLQEARRKHDDQAAELAALESAVAAIGDISADAAAADAARIAAQAAAAAAQTWNPAGYARTDGSTAFTGNIVVPNATLDTHALNRGTANSLYGGSSAWIDIASAATMNVGAAAGPLLRVTGAVTVTSLGTAASGVTRTLRAATGFALTHSANILCPAGDSIVLLANDVVRVASLGGGAWIVTDVRVLATTLAPGLLSKADKVKLDTGGGMQLVRLAPVNTTSGTAFDFLSLPSDVVQIDLLQDRCSLTGPDSFLVQLGTSSGFETTGYDALWVSSASGSSTAGFISTGTVAGADMSASITMRRVDGNLWFCHGYVISNNPFMTTLRGNKTLAGVCDRVRFTRTGTDSFDAGRVVLQYWRSP